MNQDGVLEFIFFALEYEYEMCGVSGLLKHMSHTPYKGIRQFATRLSQRDYNYNQLNHLCRNTS